MPQMIQLQSGNSNNWRDIFTSITEKSVRVLIEIFTHVVCQWFVSKKQNKMEKFVFITQLDLANIYTVL